TQKKVLKALDIVYKFPLISI
uniref:Uncharacterized protein n=1 Tax=Anopheles christyi TaxID=43041 RepID=A0A182KHT1_9DIPT